MGLESFPQNHSEQLAAEQPEESPAEVFRAYLQDLELTPEDLKKTILDVGSGTGGFAAYAKEQHINPSVVSVELFKELSKGSAGVRADVAALPFRDNAFELVISESAIPNVFVGGDPHAVRALVRRSLEEMVRVVGPGGEVRLGQVFKGERYENQRVFTQAVDDALANLTQKYHLAVRWKHRDDTYEYDAPDKKSDRLLARVYLVKIKKPYEQRE